MSLLREQGIEEAKEVKLAQLEGDGRFSVVKFKDDTPGSPACGCSPGINLLKEVLQSTPF